ncbi:MAG TPA: magnesium transporter [Dehalococcoidia bacterium]
MEGDVRTVSESLEERVRQGETDAALAELAVLHPADQAEALAGLPPEWRVPLILRMDPPSLGAVLTHLDGEDRAAVVEELPLKKLSQVLDSVDDDVAADILHTLQPEEAARVLATMTGAADVAPLLAHKDESAGGRMTRGFVALRADMTVDEAITYLRLVKPDTEEAYYLYVVDAEGRLEGVVSLRHLVVAPPRTPVSEVMSRDVVSVRAGTDQEECARLIRHYNLLALPVVDETDRLIGVVTIDDLLDVATEEATEDMYRIAGLDVQESVLSPVSTALRRRVPWLLINLMTAFLAALTVDAFEPTISRAAVLAAFMPIIAGHGGNTGTQAVTLVVRGIALGEVTQRDAMRIAAKELAFGVVHGVMAGVITAALAYVLSGNAWLAAVVLAAMVGNIIVAGLAGALIPMALRALKVDPALASAIWLTTFTDVMGFLLLLGLGTLFLDRLQ